MILRTTTWHMLIIETKENTIIITLYKKRIYLIIFRINYPQKNCIETCINVETVLIKYIASGF